MALKSGLLAETCWALDALNVLLFDDGSVAYFGLQHLPGLLDLLLDLFQKSLGDIFDAPDVDDEPWFARPVAPAPPERDAPEPPDPRDRLTVLSGENYTSETRKGRTVVRRSRDGDAFAPDARRDWDPEDEDPTSAAPEPWRFAADASGADRVVPCFRGEFVHVPFARAIRPRRPRGPKSDSEETRDRSSGRNSEARAESEVADGATESEVTRDRTKSAANELAIKVESERNGETEDATRNGPRSEGSPCDGDNLDSEPMELERDAASEEERRPELEIRDPSGSLKRRRLSDYEDECYERDEPSLNPVTESRDAMARRCLCLSNALRGLTFVPGNEAEFARSGAFLSLAGRLLLLQHEHAPRAARSRAYERDDGAACCSSLRGAAEWWWETLGRLREDALVCCANVAGRAELARWPEAVARPLLDGLLHWACCPAAAGRDALPHSPLSPRRLALEALCKLCVTDANVDLVLATPPRERLHRLCQVLARNLCRTDDQVLREFSVNLLHYLCAAESGAARCVALQAAAPGQLVGFIERAEAAALGVANQHGLNALRDNPDAMGTSLDMLRRAASTLLHLAKHPDNRPLFARLEPRLLSLVMSQILDQKVAAELAKVLFQCSRRPRRPSADRT